MGKFIDLTGQRFGRLVVISRDDNHVCPNGSQKVAWNCKCDCGNKKTVMTEKLIRKNTLSCGCLRKEVTSERSKKNTYTRKAFGESSSHLLYLSYKNGATRRKIDFLISERLFLELTKMRCYYCDDSPNQLISSKTYFGNYIYNGIDRVDSSMGYTENNVVACCGRCNTAKNDMPQSDFYAWIDRVYHHIHRKDTV